jgi:Lon protease-like protein
VATRTLPLFPLPLVLFPGGVQPLHVFEPRYRRLLADALSADRRFGIVLCEEGTAERDLPAGRVGCEAHVESVEPLPDGRSNVVVTGWERFALERFVESPAPYHVALVSDVRDVEEPDALVAPVAARVRRSFERAALASRTIADDTDDLPELPDDPAALSYAMAVLVELDLATRQRILSSRSAVGRLEEIGALLDAAVDSLESRAGAHRRARTNGRSAPPAH